MVGYLSSLVRVACWQDPGVDCRMACGVGVSPKLTLYHDSARIGTVYLRRLSATAEGRASNISSFRIVDAALLVHLAGYFRGTCYIILK